MADLNDGYMDNTVSLSDLSSSTPTPVSFDNFSTSNEEIARAERLEQAKKDKLEKLSKLNQNASLDDSYTDLGDGILESNRNKVWNDLSDQEFQSVLDYGLSNYALTPDEQGNLVYGNGETYSGPTRRLYMFGTEGANPEVKFGLAKGDLEGSEARYTPDGNLGGYGWKPGEYGVNTEDKQLDILLPDNVATMLEGLGHGRSNALANRVVKDRYGDLEGADKYGSGASEYYSSREGLLGAPAEIDKAVGEELFSQYLADVQRVRPNKGIVNEEANLQRIIRQNQEREADEGGFFNRAGNTLAGFGASFVDSLIVAPADAVGDLTGLFDIGSDEENTASVNEFFGYNPVQAERAMENIGQQWEIVADENATTAERMKAAGNGALEAFITPEMWSTSMGAVLSWITPGAILKAIGVGSKFAKTAKAIDAAAEAGDITKAAARLQKAKAFMSVDGAKAALTAQSGYMVSAMGNVNKQYNEFVENNNGVELEGAEKAKWFAGRFAVQMVNQNLDKLVDFSIIKNPGMIASAIPAVKAMTNKEFANVAKTMAKGVAVTSTNMGKEAAQEYSQTMMELFNSRYGSEKFKDVEDFTAFLTDERNTTEAGISALAGAGGSAQFEVAGSVGSAIKGGLQGAQKVKEVAQEALTPKDTGPTPESAQAEVEISKVVEANRTARTEATTPTAAYYAGQGSGDAAIIEEAKKEAKEAETSILNGTNNVFNSDEEFSVKLGKLDPLIEIAVAENPDLTVEEIQRSIIKGLKAEGQQEQEAQVEATVAKAHAAGLEFASIKPLTETAKDVESGAKGFVTYFTRAKAALAEGNTAEYEANLNRLDGFYSYQTTKAERLKAGVEQVRGVIENQVDVLVKQGKAKTRVEALRQVLSTSKDKRTTVSHSDSNNETSDIRYTDVILKMLNPSYSKGIYKLVGTIDNEVASMGKVYNTLLKNESAPVTPSATTATSTDSSPAGAEPVSTAPSQTSVEGFTDAELEAMESEVEPASTETETKTPEVTSEVSTPVEGFTDEELASLEDSFVPQEDLEVDGFTDEELEALGEGSPVAEVVDGFTEEELAAMDEGVETTPSPLTEKDSTVKAFNESRQALKDVKKRITERRAELRAQGVTTLEEVLKDEEMAKLFAEKDRLEKEQETSFVSGLKGTFEKRLSSFTSSVLPAFKFLSYANKVKTEVKTSVDKLVSKFKPTGFTLSNRNKGNATNLTKRFADKLLTSMKVTDGEFNVGLGTNFTQNPITVFLFDEKGKLNYNTVEAMQAAAYEFLVQEASNLLGANRDSQEIADLFGITSEEVTPEMYQVFASGGMIYKLAAPSIGEKLISHLGIEVEGVQNKEALATAFGMAALRALEGDFVEIDSFAQEGVLYGSVDYVKGLSSMYDTNTERRIANLYDARLQLTYFEETLGVELDKGRTYRRTKTKGKRKVYIHKSQYQEAPKDHQDVVNRLENTAFSFNSGHDVLVELFSDEEGNLDTNKLIERILGSYNKLSNKDAKDRYEAQKAALMRDIQFYQDAKEDVQDGSLFFNWFIAKNQRIHLDSNRVNPQNDKNLARWLLTTNTSRPVIKKSDIQNLLEGKSASKEAVMFVYGIVQAFDGAKGIPGVDKDNQAAVVAAAKKLLEDTTDAELVDMVKDVDHVGHAALAIANIRKYMDSDTNIESDMVLEVDGLTNGFAFRAMQFPLGAKAYQWLEKVGVIRSNSDFYSLESMSGARDLDQEDVYISVGAVFQDNIIEAKANLDDVSAKWVSLFEEFGKLPNFSDKDDASVKKFVRNLMKSPVMIFNYAAGKEKIAGGLVNDQVMGTGYLSGRGLIDALTELDGNKEYVITKAKLEEVFGKDLGSKYHKARQALSVESVTSKKNNGIMSLRADLNKAIGVLYKEPLENTLESLFAEQTAVNKVITEAGQFMFTYFKENYDTWRKANPTATEEEKTEYLRSIAQIVPGVAGASTDDQLTKVTFLKSILEPTNNYVLTNIGGNKTGTNTISRSYGDPGVGPAVLLVLSSDSSTLAKTINQAYKGKDGFGALPVHDAMVLGANEFSTISMYNLNFYSVNRNYSIIQEFVSAIEGLENFDGNVVYKKVFNKATRKFRSFADMKKDLVAKNREVQQARKELFDNELKIGQMVGPEGSMVVVNPEQMKTVAKKVVSKASDTLLSRFKEKRVQKALGKDYAKALARIEKMLEGCK
jgi:hypothetical protein